MKELEKGHGHATTRMDLEVIMLSKAVTFKKKIILTVQVTTKVLRVCKIIKPDSITAAGWKENGELLP